VVRHDRRRNTLELVLALHVGTLVSIILVYWKDLIQLPRQPWLCGLLILATIPAGIVGLLSEGYLRAGL
jgi:undecaprenyl pyrophosphate phosphatase UppP